MNLWHTYNGKFILNWYTLGTWMSASMPVGWRFSLSKEVVPFCKTAVDETALFYQTVLKVFFHI